MTNSYGYNRKTQHEDEVILNSVKYHHNTLLSKGYTVIMTSLVGSQNYDLDDQDSDIDTYSLILPPIKDLARAEDAKAGILFLEDGHCNFKDMRVALHLLEKTSPNSIEYFISKYKIYNPAYEEILKKYLDDNKKMWTMGHCNYHHMLYAMAGMATQLTKRNMPAGKRFSHALRLDDMQYHFFNSYNAEAILEMRAGGNRDLAMIAKRDLDEAHEKDYNAECTAIADKLALIRDDFHRTDEQKIIEKEGLKLIDTFRWEIFQKYLKENSKKWN